MNNKKGKNKGKRKNFYERFRHGGTHSEPAGEEGMVRCMNYILERGIIVHDMPESLMKSHKECFDQVFHYDDLFKVALYNARQDYPMVSKRFGDSNEIKRIFCTWRATIICQLIHDLIVNGELDTKDVMEGFGPGEIGMNVGTYIANKLKSSMFKNSFSLKNDESSMNTFRFTLDKMIENKEKFITYMEHIMEHQKMEGKKLTEIQYLRIEYVLSEFPEFLDLMDHILKRSDDLWTYCENHFGNSSKIRSIFATCFGNTMGRMTEHMIQSLKTRVKYQDADFLWEIPIRDWEDYINDYTRDFILKEFWKDQ